MKVEKAAKKIREALEKFCCVNGFWAWAVGGLIPLRTSGVRDGTHT